MKRGRLVCLVAFMACALAGCGGIPPTLPTRTASTLPDTWTPAPLATWVAPAIPSDARITSPAPPAATPSPPTPVPIGGWLAEGIPPDTLIQFHTFVDEFRTFPGMEACYPKFIEIRADGSVRTTMWAENPEAAASGAGRISEEELKVLLLQFAEIDFFGLRMEGPLCVYHASRPPAAGQRPSMMPGAPQVEVVTHITTGGRGKTVGYVTGFATSCDPLVLGADGWPERSEGTLAELERAILEIGRQVAGDPQRATPHVTPTATPTAARLPGAPDPPGQAEALALIYGDALICQAQGEGAEPVCQRRWPEALTDPRFVGVFSTDLLTTRVVLGVPHRQQGVDRYLVVTPSNEEADTCHACAPVLDGAVLSWLDCGWALTSLTQGVLQAGLWGDPPYLAEGLRMGPEKQGALFRGGERSASGAEETAYVVAPVDDGLRTVLELAVSAGNLNRCLTINEYLCIDCNTTSELTTQNDPVPCWSYDSEIEAVPGTNPDYYDLKVTTRGTVPNRPADGKDMFLAPAGDIAIYRFVEGEYRKK